MKLDERERPSCTKEVEMSSLSPFMRTSGKFLLCIHEMTACFILLWLNKTRLCRPHFSIIVSRSLERSEAEMFRWNGI